MAEEDEGAIGADWAKGAEGALGARGLRELRGLRRIRGLLYIINVRWLGHHGNRLYGFMRLRSKMLTG